LQRILKKEAKEGLDEDAIIDLDDEISESIERLLEFYKRFSDV
jgi:hypothetical protein